MSKKTTLLVLLLVMLLLSGALVFLFRSDILNLLGLKNSYPVPKKDFRGEAITFNAGGRQVAIPPNFSSDTLSYLKQEMTENGGLPLVIDKKGNPLPFGIP